MSSFPLPANEAERLTALNSYNILDTAEEKDFDELTELASIICQTPVALISLVDDKRQWFKSHIGITVSETTKELSFCAHAIASFDDIMIIKDATKDTRFATNPLVTGDTNIVFYAGVPLINENGYALGSLCVIDHQVKELLPDQVNALKVLARQVVNKLELKRKVAQVENANQELKDSNFFIQKFASMAAHDIKNPLSSILLTSQALKMRLEKNADEASGRLIDLNITSIRNLVTMLDDMLAYSKDPSLLIIKKKNIDLVKTLKKVITMVGVPNNFTVRLPEEPCPVHISEVAIEQIFINLLSNAIRYNDKENGWVNIRFGQDADYYQFEVEDNGIGIAPEYHDKIFTNNFTLKMTDRYNKNGTGIGLHTVKEILKNLKGTIQVKSAVGEGATFFISVRK